MPLEKWPAVVAPIKNGLCHFVPHVILHLMVYWLSLQKNGGPYGEGQSMDAYRGIFVLCTINSPCA